MPSQFCAIFSLISFWLCAEPNIKKPFFSKFRIFLVLLKDGI